MASKLRSNGKSRCRTEPSSSVYEDRLFGSIKQLIVVCTRKGIVNTLARQRRNPLELDFESSQFFEIEIYVGLHRNWSNQNVSAVNQLLNTCEYMNIAVFKLTFNHFDVHHPNETTNDQVEFTIARTNQ